MVTKELLDPLRNFQDSLRAELDLIWAAHSAVGLKGYMALYTDATQHPWRSKHAGDHLWFGPKDTDKIVRHIEQLYGEGELPNSTPLLNPLVHEKMTDGSYKPIGSGIFWSTAFVLGIARMKQEQQDRLTGLGALSDHFHRGENKQAGLKMLAFSNKKLEPKYDGRTVAGCRELYELTDIHSDDYWPYYPLSGLNYLCIHGMYTHPDIHSLLPEEERKLSPKELVRIHQIDVQKVIDANTCWNAYDHHNTLYHRFGQDVKDIPHNNKFYDLCARDLQLFDRTGPMRIGAEETFEFVVPGYIPRGAVTLLPAAGGTGKSSVAHQLCVLASIDWEKDEPKPVWLGQPINTDVCTGICIYFSGEDGPAIINARGALFDPEGRAKRLQFHRTEFIDKEITFAEYLKGLMKMPDVSIVVIDPARKYLDGDENDADSVSRFFEAIEEFAIRKNAAMVVCHHLQKGAHPTNSREVLDELRGSQVFIDRPRVVLGMCRDDKYTVVGLSKCNIPPNLGMIQEERVFARNPQNLHLIWLPGEKGIRRQNLSAQEIEQIEMEAFKAQLKPKPE